MLAQFLDNNLKQNASECTIKGAINTARALSPKINITDFCKCELKKKHLKDWEEKKVWRKSQGWNGGE